jgi:hypothetical protein
MGVSINNYREPNVLGFRPVCIIRYDLRAPANASTAAVDLFIIISALVRP